VSKAKKYIQPKPHRSEGFVILNPFGDVWSPKVFGSETEAMTFVSDFWGRINSAKNINGYRAVRGHSETFANLADANNSSTNTEPQG
jgi:hypothetical protein